METFTSIVQIATAIMNQQGRTVLVVIAVGSDGYAYQLEGDKWIRLPQLPSEIS